jgi:hypothetical protein
MPGPHPNTEKLSQMLTIVSYHNVSANTERVVEVFQVFISYP